MNAGAAAWAAGTAIASPALRVLLKRRAARGKELPHRLPERYGIESTPRPPGTLVWIHAASVGETVSVLPVLRELSRQAPHVTILMTTGTVTSAALLERRLPELECAGRILHRFVPLDVPGWVGRFVDHWRPNAGALIESELWPNLLAACKTRQIPLALLNARMSDRSFRAWRRAPGTAAFILGCFSAIEAQSQTNAERLIALGAQRVSAPGNLKFAAPPLPVDETALREARIHLGQRPAWVAASTHPGEEELILAAHRALALARPGLVTIIIPRHPERGGEIERLIAPLPAARRSARQLPARGGIWIGDTLGELGLWYRLAPIVLMGRSLSPPGGGQNPLEPARLGSAVAAGPYMSNFIEPVRVLQQAGGLTTVPDAPAIASWVQQMLDSPLKRVEAGRRAMEAVRGHDGLPARAAQTILGLLR